jgi:hypothetical protein
MSLIYVNLSDMLNLHNIYAWQKVAKWQLGRELLHDARVHASPRGCDKL